MHWSEVTYADVRARVVQVSAINLGAYVGKMQKFACTEGTRSVM
jgi:hypothetical protein